jgi:hypothetical protein
MEKPMHCFLMSTGSHVKIMNRNSCVSLHFASVAALSSHLDDGNIYGEIIDPERFNAKIHWSRFQFAIGRRIIMKRIRDDSLNGIFGTKQWNSDNVTNLENAPISSSIAMVLQMRP